MMKQLIKPLIIIFSIIIFCAILVRVVMSGDTIYEYAQKNPGIADASPEPVVEAEAFIEVMEDEEDGLPAEDEISDDAGEGDEESVVNFFASIWSDPEHLTEYRPGFSKEPIGDALFAYMKGISFPISLEEAISIIYGDDGDFDFFAEDDELESERAEWLDEIYALLPNIVENPEKIAISREDLTFLSVLYYDFDGDEQLGEMVCNVLIADDLLAIFYELYLTGYQFERISLIENYGGSDFFSMLYNNTSSFNYRESSPGRLSLHAYGLAVDVNPFNNPYVAYNNNGTIRKVSPVGSEEYVDRGRDFPHKIDEEDMLYQLFMEKGFFWGGNWKYQKDYHHFEKALVER